jgi:hypothetical protein
MSVHGIARRGNANGAATPTTVPIYVDSADNKLKMIPAGSGSTVVEVIDASSTQTLTGKTITGSTVVSLVDAAGIIKYLSNSVAKTIVDSAATALFSVAVAASAMVGGFGIFLVRATDGTDMQADAGFFSYSAEAKATVVVGAITYVAANEAKSVSAGTLTLAFTADVSVANVVTYKLQPTGSLTETAPYTVEYTLFPVRGVVTIL